MGLLGAHVSVSGGLDKSIARGEELECDAIQIFSKNQRQWMASPLSEESITIFKKSYGESKIQQIIIHDSYLINLCNPDDERLKKSRDAFLDEMIRADLISVPYLVFHPGSHLNTSEEEGTRRIAESLNIVLKKQDKGKVKLLLETTAGQGDHVGYLFEQLAAIIAMVDNKDRIGICFDTAHAFAAGYDIRTATEYNNTFRIFDSIVGLDRIQVFHLNDSKSELGSRVDRHEQIGKGKIGLNAFRFLINDSRFREIPMILETPEGEKYYKTNLNLLRSLIES
jgi:deoxyribonuclease-4